MTGDCWYPGGLLLQVHKKNQKKYSRAQKIENHLISNYFLFIFIIQMRNLSRQKIRTIHRQNAVPRTFTAQKPAGASTHQKEIRIGKYKYNQSDQLGKGFSGNVYKAVETLKQHKRYAIKVVELKKFRGANLQMLESEIDIHRILQHQHIVRLHQVIKTSHHYYLVMQYCPHGNLTQYIAQKKQLSESNAIQIVTQLISAYKYLLQQGVIHRDIKPANILRMGNKWKLSDFGFSAKSKFGFKDKMNVGTPLYMAPESLKKSYYSYKSDLFSIGIVLYEMLVGQTPHQVNSEKQLLQKISHEIVLPKTIKNSKIGEFLSKICLINEGKRMSKQEFISFQFGSNNLNTPSQNGSILSNKDKKSSNDESASKNSDLQQKIQEDTPNKGNSRQHSRQRSSTSKAKYSTIDQASKPHVKNPMFINKQILSQQFQFVQHFYFTIKNIDSFHLQATTQSMLILSLFKLLLKLLRLLCNKSQNYLQLANWEEFKHCKLYLQLYSKFNLYSEQYEKEYLEFIKHNDIKVIRAVNRKFPQLCNTAPLTTKFYQNFKNFMATVIRQHESQVQALVQQGEEKLNNKLQALDSAYKIYKFSQARITSSSNSSINEKLSLLEDYTKSKLARISFNNLRRLVKQI